LAKKFATRRFSFGSLGEPSGTELQRPPIMNRVLIARKTFRRESSMNKKGRRSFGYIRKLPSKLHQASHVGLDGPRY
jgi:hypothetical protein